MLSKTFNVANEKYISQNCLYWTMVHQRGFSPIIKLILRSFVQAKFFAFFTNSHFSTLNYFRNSSKIFVLLALKNFKPFKKHGIVLLVSGNQYCCTEPI